MKVTVEETLAASDVTTALTTGPYLIYSEVLEGARRPLVFLQCVEEMFDLIGKAGNTIKFLKASQLSASSTTESSMLSSGMSASDKSLSAVSVSVSNVIYSATELSDILAEDYPNISWLRVHLRNMGKACMEYLDAHVKDTIIAASGVSTHSCTNLDYGEVLDAKATLENNEWYADPNNPPFLYVSPDAAAYIMKDTAFVSTERYTTSEVANMVQGELGRFAGLRLMKSSLLDGTGYALIVHPPDGPNGPVVVLAWKRRLTVKNEREEKYGYTYFNTTLRAKAVVVQAAGICKISISSSP